MAAAEFLALASNQVSNDDGLTSDLQFFVGEPLNAVSFVMDYVELHFNGSYLRCLTPPTIIRHSAAVTFPDTGSRDAICGLIGSEVRQIAAEDGGELRVHFDDGTIVTASLSHQTRVSPEVLHFHNQATGQTQFW
jgi:hypothetical protein